MIKNLNQLKRALRPGMRLEVKRSIRPIRSSMRQTRGAAPSSGGEPRAPGNLKMGCVSRTPVALIMAFRVLEKEAA